MYFYPIKDPVMPISSKSNLWIPKQLMHYYCRLTFILTTTLFIISCSKPLYKFPYSESIIPSKKRVAFTITSNPQDSLHILYLGCGHMVITRKGESIMTDPFVSTQKLIQTGLGQIKLNREAYKKFEDIVQAQQVDLKSVKSVWIAHSHYDHMMDLPVMMERQVFDPSAVIYGNAFADKILTNFLKPGSYPYHVIQPSETYCQSCSTQQQHWLKAAPNIRIMPIHSDHAAHVKFLSFNIHLMQGRLKENYFRDNYTSLNKPTKANQWREGCTYSFLVDFMEDDVISFRMFIQTSASNFPLGSPPEELIRQHPVDLAVLCAASTNNVNVYPKKIMDHIGAKKLLLVHWEDFFNKALEFDDPRLVRFTQYKKVAKRLGQWNTNVKDDVLMPRPGTMITIKY